MGGGRGKGQGAGSRPAAPAAKRRPWLAWAAVAVVVVAAGIGYSWRARHRELTPAQSRAVLAGRQPAPGALNVVVVTLDTTRADRLGCYGFPRVETPAIDALARDGFLFERATATVPLTFPSHSSIFTGLIPPHHGVRDNGGFFLDESRTTLAERLKAGGWATGAFIGAWVLESKWGLSQGFDTYADQFDLSRYKIVSLGTVQKKGDEVMDGALGWLETVKDRRFFAWVHLYDPHMPYDPPEPYKSRYAAEPYVGEIAYADHVVGRLTTWLRDRKLMDRTLIVVTGDHGESLGEHGETSHAFFVYDATSHVPLIVRTPWGDRGRSGAQVSSVDIMPTILDLVGLPPQPDLDGRSLAPALLGAPLASRPAYTETYFPRYHFGWQHLRAMGDGRWHYVEAPEPELYDVRADPGEMTNVFKTNSVHADELRAAMAALVGAAAQAAPERQKLDPETLQRLAALGYVGSVAEVDPAAVLPDPKSKLALFNLMGTAKDEAQAGHTDEAIASMQRVIAQDPKIVDAHLTLGNWLVKAQRLDDAVAAFKEALALKPDNEIAMTNLARVYKTRGQNEAAIEGYRSALKVDPKSPQNWYQLATLYLDLDRVEDAEVTFRKALENNPKMGAAYNSLGVIAFAQGRVEEAERLVRRGLELESRVRTGRYNLARILEAKGDRAGAEALYRAELETYPDHAKARFNLAQLLRAKGDGEGFVRELAAGVESAPECGACFFYLARVRLDDGQLDAAADLAERGLAVDARSEVAPLGHYVLADVYNRRGEPGKAQSEVVAARRVEAEVRARPRPRI